MLPALCCAGPALLACCKMGVCILCAAMRQLRCMFVLKSGVKAAWFTDNAAYVDVSFA